MNDKYMPDANDPRTRAQVKADYHGAKFDQGKAMYDLILPEFEEAIAEILTFGADKYGPHSWRTVPDAKERYYAALIRHVNAHRKGERYDPETGKLHLAHASCNMYFLTQLALEEEKDQLALKFNDIR